MSKLDKLIKELCPDGVEYKKIQDIVKCISTGLNPRKNFVLNKAGAKNFYVTVKEITTGKVVFSDKTDMIDDDAVKIIQGRSNLEYGDVLLSGIGTIGKVALVDIPIGNWNCSESVVLIKPNNDVILSEFLAYILGCKQVQNYFNSNARGSTLKGIRQQDLRNLSIPVPPLPVQEEIVRILDTFTELTKELTKELTERRRQYEYYCDALLTRETKAERKKLGEVFYTRNGYTPSTSNPDYWDNGKIPWFVMDDIRKNGRILSDSIQHVTESAIKKSGLFPANSIIVSTSATIGEHALITTDFLCNQRFTCLYPKPEYKNKINMKFMLYYAFKLDEFCKKNTTKSSFASVDMSRFYDFEIPLPPLDVQERLVRVLDNFDSICSDLNIGLPAEIEARKKQYEFYRDALLTFAESGRIAADNVGGGYHYDLIRIVQYVFGYVSLPLSEICHSIASGNSKTKEVNGKYPVYGSTGIIAQTNQATYTKSNILVARVGANAGYTHLAHGEYDVSDNTLIVDVKGEYNLKYIYYQLINEDLHRYAKGGGQPLVTAGQIKKVVLPIPPLAEQKRIAEILDRFDALCNDISQGIPAEIEARRKQYEYYRDKLLTFEERTYEH